MINKFKKKYIKVFMNKKEEIPERNVWFYCQICHIVPSVQIIYDNNFIINNM